uniref:Solute carrier organic anion transporter family member 2B1 n=1 Tax=Malurus cyaneus samueli TaxID=2593467 RepID=A0A8C5UB77_9PASS
GSGPGRLLARRRGTPLLSLCHRRHLEQHHDLGQPQGSGSGANVSHGSCTPHSSRENHEVLMVMFTAQALLGIGGVPIQPFGISYIDDFASDSNSPLYLGEGTGTVLRGQSEGTWTEGTILRLTAQDPRWVGAWWLGFLVAASLVALSALPYFFFPREMPKEVREGQIPARVLSLLAKHPWTQTPRTQISYPPRYNPLVLSGFPVVLLRNLRHPVFLLVVLAQVNISAMVAGLATFMGKFLERQFSLTASLANMIIGECSQAQALGSGCSSAQVPSARFSHPLGFLSSLQSYSSCSCIPGTLGSAKPGSAKPDSAKPGSATPGSCGSGCAQLLVPFVVLSCLAGILASTSHTPSFMLILRSIQPEDKSFAVGIQFMLLRVLAWMPGPVLYGSAIDTSCVLWERRCGRRAACRYYDNTRFRHRYLGLQFFFEVGAFLCFGAVFLILRRQEREASKAEESKADPEKEKLAGNSSKSPESKV